ncbi:LuxR C-terminal-related transcriptional regulator [Nocardioides sp. SR21]|uniref:LuxR C-terminal-related transcriptional regulator n=1 Tax=Nocardioides sp. SR21 TaxID=2919501 RepID=UPI001FAA53E4|nr:LuxR C-terminal-related transcriptional regulator [Nocardioides sp. SR21]
MRKAGRAPSGSPGARVASPFFRSKFRVPTVPDHFVPRERLVELLDDLSGYAVTAVVAPAGAGKTALASDWVRRGRRPSAWLALDEADGDPAQFWTALTAALEPLAPGIGTVIGATGLDEIGRALADDLEQVDATPSVLVVDDVHLLDGEPDSQAALASFVEHKPDWLHVLLLSRRRLPLRVERLRAAGVLADVEFDLLRFQDDEATAMLTRLCPDAPTEMLPGLAARAGGWAAALQLTALSIRSRRGRQLAVAEAAPTSASDRLVDEYVWREVLRTERRELISLLLAIAVVDRVNYGLAEALTARQDAGDLLEEARARGLFVTSLDAGGWFEVHGLVRDMLLAELERRSPETLREQHTRAARWFESMGDGPTAVEHWLAAGDARAALRLLSEIAIDLSESGRSGTIARVLDAVPAEVSSADPESLVLYAWCRLFVERAGFLDALAAAQSAMDGPRLLILAAAERFLAGDWPGCEALARQGLQGLGDRVWQDPIGRAGWSLVAHGLALDEGWNDAGHQVGEARIAVSNDPGRRMAFEGTRALGLALSGHPLDELRSAAGVRHLADSAALATLRTELALADAIVAREVGDHRRAEESLAHLAAQQNHPFSFVPLLAQLELVEMRLGDGRRAEAQAAFAAATVTHEEQYGGPEPGPSRLTGRLARAGMLLSLATDDLDAAGQWAGRVDDPFWGPWCLAKVEIAHGRNADAVEVLARALPRCVRHHVLHDLVLAQAVAEVSREDAAKSVAVAVELAAEHGMLQSVASEGAAVLELIELAAWAVPDGWMDRLRRLLVSSWEVQAPRTGLVEDLTDRERDVLRLLPSRLSLREIAAELFVSQNTLKFHLRVIYRKLGVNSRAEAVEAARQLRLLPRSAIG